MRDNEEIHDDIQDDFCGCCKGHIGCDYNGSWLDCDEYKEEYDAIEKEWAEEDKEYEE